VIKITSGKSAPRQEGRGAAGFRLPLLPSGPGGVGRHPFARFLTRGISC